MQKLRLSTSCLFTAAAVAAAFQADSAQARPPYKKEFDAMYVTSDADPKFVKAVEAAKCNICHVGKKKTNRNAYGKALAKLLEEGDEKDIPKIKSALEAVAQEPSNPKKPESPTFGQRIKSGKLPGGG